VCVPVIEVEKDIVCKLPGTACSDATGYSQTATGVKVGNDCPAFCYRIIVRNAGNEVLNSVTVNDSQSYTSCESTFPTTLAVGASFTNFCTRSQCNSTTNTVIARGTGATSGITVADTNDAVAIVKSASISCTKEVSADGVNYSNSLTISNTTTVYYRITVSNTSDAGVGLENVSITDPNVPACNTNGITLAAGGSFTKTCTDEVACPGGQNNTATVAGEVDDLNGTICVHNSSGNRITVQSTCSASVNCVSPQGCRVTGGGRQDNRACPDADPITGKPIRYVTHGGQVGAPFAQTTDCVISNPCIRGEWQHVRHYQGGLRGVFHARSNGRDHNFDSLHCACLDCLTLNNPSTSLAPGVVSDPTCRQTNFTYAGENPVVDGVCNPDDRKNGCGPMPRPAPANKICFSGQADYTLSKGKKTEQVVFRVDIEDRSEPGGGHPGGAVAPPDRYRIRMWFLGRPETDTQAEVLALRCAVACDSNHVTTEVVATSLAPDIDDGGDLDRGNHQIHPVTGANGNCP
jgi:hypothetical protein